MQVLAFMVSVVADLTIAGTIVAATFATRGDALDVIIPAIPAGLSMVKRPTGQSLENAVQSARQMARNGADPWRGSYESKGGVAITVRRHHNARRVLDAYAVEVDTVEGPLSSVFKWTSDHKMASHDLGGSLKDKSGEPAGSFTLHGEDDGTYTLKLAGETHKLEKTSTGQPTNPEAQCYCCKPIE